MINLWNGVTHAEAQDEWHALLYTLEDSLVVDDPQPVSITINPRIVGYMEPNYVTIYADDDGFTDCGDNCWECLEDVVNFLLDWRDLVK